MVHFVFWMTQNSKKHRELIEYCKDFGLKRLQAGVFLGKLSIEERYKLETEFRKLLAGVSDNFYIIPLCNDCWNKKVSRDYEPEKQILKPKEPFEVIA